MLFTIEQYTPPCTRPIGYRSFGVTSSWARAPSGVSSVYRGPGSVSKGLANSGGITPPLLAVLARSSVYTTAGGGHGQIRAGGRKQASPVRRARDSPIEKTGGHCSPQDAPTVCCARLNSIGKAAVILQEVSSNPNHEQEVRREIVSGFVGLIYDRR